MRRSGRSPDILTSLFPGADERRGVLLELPTGRRQRGDRLVPDEECAAELVFQRVDPGLTVDWVT